MSEIRSELKYLSSHEWARVEDDGTVTIGITDHAQAALGDVVIDLRHQRLDCGNVLADLAIVLVLVDHPRGLEHEELELLQFNVAVGDIHLHRLVVGREPRSGGENAQRFLLP